MALASLTRTGTLVLPSLLLLAACGTPRSTPTSALAATGTASTSASTGSGSSNPALQAALTADDLSAIGVFTQKSDTLLGGAPGTDSRAFTNAEGSLAVEIDLADDTGASSANADYPAYQSAAAAQVTVVAVTPSTGLGQDSDEYVGTNAHGKIAASLSFIEGRFIAVVTVVASGSAGASTAQSTAESIAQAEDARINSIGS